MCLQRRKCNLLLSHRRLSLYCHCQGFPHSQLEISFIVTTGECVAMMLTWDKCIVQHRLKPPSWCHHPTQPLVVSLVVTRWGLSGKWTKVTPMSSVCLCHWLIRRNITYDMIRALIWEVGLCAGAFEASVGVLGVVERHAVHTQHVGLQVALLGGTVGAVTAPERSLAWRQKQRKEIF